nr:uncharacterized protein LOC129013244 isoform X3 [Pongo pygmaeus]
MPLRTVLEEGDYWGARQGFPEGSLSLTVGECADCAILTGICPPEYMALCLLHIRPQELPADTGLPCHAVSLQPVWGCPGRATSCLHPERSDVGEFQSHSPTLDELLQPQCYSGSSKTWSRCRPQELPADTSLPCYTVSLQPVQGSQGDPRRLPLSLQQCRTWQVTLEGGMFWPGCQVWHLRSSMRAVG